MPTQEMQDTWVHLSQEDPQDEGTPAILPGESQWTEEPDRPSLVSVESRGHNRGNLACMHAYMLIFPCSVRGEGLKADYANSNKLI